MEAPRKHGNNSIMAEKFNVKIWWGPLKFYKGNQCKTQGPRPLFFLLEEGTWQHWNGQSDVNMMSV